MNSQVLIDLLRDIKPILNGVRLYSPSERTKEAAHKLIIRISDALTAPDPITDHLPDAKKMVAPIPDAGEGVEVVGYMHRGGALITTYKDYHTEPVMTVAQHNRIVSALQASAMAVPKCKCSMSISVLGDGCRYCQPQEYIDRLHDQMEDDLAMVVPDGWIAVSDRLPEVPEGEEQEVIVCVKRAHNGESYVFSARYLNAFPLHEDCDDDPMIVTGWHDVKEHSEYDGWYSKLIDDGSGDEVTNWMPLEALPTPGDSK